MPNFEIRLALLERAQVDLVTKLEELGESIEGLKELKNKVEGAMSLMKWVGWGGIATCAALLLRAFIQDVR